MTTKKEKKQFHELTECELNDLKQELYEKAVKENRDLLIDLRCIYKDKEK